jgi:hypothetical protein
MGKNADPDRDSEASRFLSFTQDFWIERQVLIKENKFPF